MTDVLENPRVHLGANNPPAPTPFDGFLTHIEDLMVEARNFLDGSGVQTEDEATGVSKLLDQLRTVFRDADKARTAEKRPHDDAAKAVQARWKPLLDRCDTAAHVCKDALRPYLQRLEAEKREVERIAREAADRQRAEAEAAVRTAGVTDLEAREQAEAAVAEAKRAEATANRAAGDRAQAKGGARATTLRSVWEATLADRREACRHYWTVFPEAFDEVLQQLADADVRSGKRAVPGFEITEAKVVV